MRLKSRHITGARVCAILLVLVQLVYVISRFSSVTCKIWPFRRVSFTKNETNIHEQFSHVFFLYQLKTLHHSFQVNTYYRDYYATIAGYVRQY